MARSRRKRAETPTEPTIEPAAAEPTTEAEAPVSPGQAEAKQPSKAFEPEEESTPAMEPAQTGVAEELSDLVEAEVGGEEEVFFPEGAEEGEEKRLNLEVQITERSACERHIVVTVPREDIERYFQKEFDELAETAVVPGFRPGRAPRKLIERRFRKNVADSVKLSVVFDAIDQINQQYKLTPIGEPELNLDAVILPDEGPLTFEYDLEVRPKFTVPEWRGMQLERWKVEASEAEVDRQLRRLLEEHGQLETYEGPAEVGDYVVMDLEFRLGDQVVAQSAGERIRIKRILSFYDAEIENFDQLMKGVRPGDVRQCTVKISPACPDVSLRGAEVTAIFTVREVMRLRVPELTPELLEKLGVQSEEDLRERIRQDILAEKAYLSRRYLRRQITNNLLKDAKWELPQRVLVRQARREYHRAVLELRDAGLSAEQIRQLTPSIASKTVTETAEALREHFIFEEIAQQLGLTVSESEVNEVIRRMARQQNMSPRRLRARLTQTGQLDAVVNMVLEQKVLNAILEEATIVEVSMPEGADEVESLRRAIGSLPEELTTVLNAAEV
ncbi:MAG: trigger factor [Thermoguttaceae bacterium]|nr:trigger factor [Thermoguttaceae bacterium]MDW8077474.1 trigger factor [Thermoguttaceae bacterium]